MKRILALTILLTGCQSGPIAHDAPVRLFHPNIPTLNGVPHPGWSYALRERMRRESRSPLKTQMDVEDARFMASVPLPSRFYPDNERDSQGLLPLFPLRK